MATIVFAVSDLPSQYSAGDAIDVLPDDLPLTEAITLPPDQGGKFYRVTITNVTVEQVRQVMGPLWEDAVAGDPEFEATDAEDRRIRRAKSRWNADLSQLPPNLVNEINSTGHVSGTLQQFRQALRAKRWDRAQGRPVDDGEVLA